MMMMMIYQLMDALSELNILAFTYCFDTNSVVEMQKLIIDN